MPEVSIVSGDVLPSPKSPNEGPVVTTRHAANQPASPPPPPSNGRASSAAAAVAAAVAAATQKAMAGAAAVGGAISGSSSAAGSASAKPDIGPLPSPANYRGVRIKGQGLAEDRVARENEEIRCAIEVLRSMLDEQPHLELRYAESEDDYNEALKLYRDMNHLSLSGVTCEQVVEHVLSHTVVLFYKPSPDQPAIAVTAATFSMRQNTMMLRLLATHPRMTRKGFARITVHFLKEVCRALFKSDILVYTYPSSSPFYKAMHFKHTHPSGENQKPPPVEAGADAAEREKARDARRVFSAKENEMIFHVQPSMQQVLDEIAHRSANGVSSYACTRRRGTNAGEEEGESSAAGAAAPPPAPAAAAAAASGRGGRGKRSAEPPPPPPPPAHTVGRGRKGRDSKAPTPSIPAMANGRAVVPSGSSLREANGHEKAARWLKAVTPAYVPGADDEDEDGVETTVSPRKRPKLGKEGRDEYAVEKIVDVHRSADGKDIKYLIKWKGWPSKYNTWEPLKHLTSLKAEIAAFESGR